MRSGSGLEGEEERQSLQGSGKGGAVKLEECLKLYAEEERVEDFKCPDCNEHLQGREGDRNGAGSSGGRGSATKQIGPYTLPPVLVIHLRRFRHNVSGLIDATSKDTRAVEFPLELDLSELPARARARARAQAIHEQGHVHEHEHARANMHGV